VVRIAFFVEGLTEQLFLEKLLLEVFGNKDIAVNVKKIKGGTSIPIAISEISSMEVTEETKYYVLIFDCGGDSNVKSYILDQRNSLLKTGYSKIIGIRDVYPDFERHEIHDLIYGLKYQLPQKDLPTKFVLSVMEIEAWFLAEETHYKRIDEKLTMEYIEENIGFNPSTYNTELRDAPSNDLNQIYGLVGKEYVKEKTSLETTVNALDYGSIYFDVNTRITSLKELIDEINQIFV